MLHSAKTGTAHLGGTQPGTQYTRVARKKGNNLHDGSIPAFVGSAALAQHFESHSCQEVDAPCPTFAKYGVFKK